MVAGLAGGIYPTSGSLFAASGRSRGSTAARGPPLRRQTRRLEVVRRSMPRSVSALLPCRISGLRLYLLQYGTISAISAIAENLCFADASSFSRAFRREFRYSPSEVRSAELVGLALGATSQHRVLSDRADLSALPPRSLSTTSAVLTPPYSVHQAKRSGVLRCGRSPQPASRLHQAWTSSI